MEEALNFVSFCNTLWINVAETHGNFNFRRRREFYRKWRGYFGINPVEVHFVWNIIEQEATTCILQHGPEHLLMGLNFLRVYDTEDRNSHTWKLTRSNWRIHVWNILEIIRTKLENKVFLLFFKYKLFFLFKIDFETRHDHWRHTNPSCVVDTIACQVQAEHLLNPRRFYSMKHKIHCLKYQVVVSMRNPRILYISNGFPGSTHDLTIARRTGFVHELSLLGETCIGDKAYQGPHQFMTPFKEYTNIPLHPVQIRYNQLVN